MSTAPDAALQPSALNVPNALTALRCVLVPVFAWLLMAEDGQNPSLRYAAAGVFALASITDWVDGWLARRQNLVTTFGKVADPIADKALTGVALIGLSLLGELSWWVTVLIIGREVAVTAIRFWVIRDGVIPASRGGKAKTVSQMLAILLYLLPLTGSMGNLKVAMMGIALILTLATGLDYVGRAIAVRRRASLRREAFGKP